MSRKRKRPKDAPTFVASFPLEVTAAQRAEITNRFDAAGRLYNACLGEARKRAERMRADPRWEEAKAFRKGPERTARFKILRVEYAFSKWDLMSFASGCRVAWLREKVFAQEAPDHDREIRRLQRRLDRQHRATSPGCFDEKGRHQKGGCDWKERSKRTQQTKAKLADAKRRLAAHRRSLHGNLANRILGLGVTIKAEKVSYKAFQRSFGRSVGRRAPGMFMMMLARKAASASGKLIEVNTRTTALSQTCLCGRRERKPLSQRTHRCGCGIVCDRDVFSGFLVRHVDADAADVHRLDVESARLEWWARRDGIRDWPASKRFNRRVPQRG